MEGNKETDADVVGNKKGATRALTPKKEIGHSASGATVTVERFQSKELLSHQAHSEQARKARCRGRQRE
jgi:hypothetical protein